MSFRLILQPLVAAILAIRDGLTDAREGRPPYLSALCTDRANQRQLLLEGWKAVAKVFFVAIVLDFIYQILVLHWFYPGQALVVAAVLALLPYLLIRGPLNRLARRRRQRVRGLR